MALVTFILWVWGKGMGMSAMQISDLLVGYYPWMKAFHVLSVIFWMAGLLYLPRLFVYQIEAQRGGDVAEAMKIHQRLLLKRIINPAMHATWFFAILLMVANPSLFSEGWFHVKLTAVILLTGVHGFYSVTRRKLEKDKEVGSGRKWRLLNEMPALLAILIVIMAIVEPF